MPETQTTKEQFASVYVIYSADIVGREDEIDGMGPFRKAPDHGAYAQPFPGEWVQTESDSEYGYGYLADEDLRPDWLPVDEGGDGRHRKWVAELSLADWREVAEQLCIELEPNGLPEHYNETMGSLTEYGAIPAVAVDNNEGWSPIRVVDSMLYVSFALIDNVNRAIR